MARRLVALLAVAAAAVAGASIAGDAAPAGATAATTRVERAPARWIYICPLPRRYRAAFDDAARRTGLPLGLLVAVGEIESNLRHEARSHAGARGLLQVMPATAAELRIHGPDARSNVLAGAHYLRQLLQRFGSVDLALAAYNAGPTAVEGFGGAPTGQTLTYVANVKERWRVLRGCR